MMVMSGLISPSLQTFRLNNFNIQFDGHSEHCSGKGNTIIPPNSPNKIIDPGHNATQRHWSDQL